MSKRTLFSALLVVGLGAALTWLLLGRPATGIDDADIFFVYARNLADGHGFVYNVGGERVEGFTSLSWTLICAGFSALLHALEIPLWLLNILLGATAVGACLKRAEYPRVFLVALAAAPAWFAWCQVTLMETGLWCLLITLTGLAVAERRVGLTAALLPLMIITRPESMLWGAWAVLLTGVLADRGARVRSLVPPLLAYGLTLAALVGFRKAYFGWPVPNTYYAKVSPGLFTNIASGLDYFRGYVFSGAAVLLLLATLALVLCRRGAKWNTSSWIALFLLPGLGVPVLVGGDHFGAFRFYQPLWPLLCLIGANELPRLTRRLDARARSFALVGLCVAGWLAFPRAANVKHEFAIAQEGRANGAALTTLFGDLDAWPTVAVITAGGNKLGYPGRVYDLMGLNDTEMAHASGDAANFKNHVGFNRTVFYRWAPDVLLRGDSEEFDSLVLNGLHGEAEFLSRYVLKTARVDGVELTAWFRADFLERAGVLAPGE